MPSKYFVPKQEDLEHADVNGSFFCETCDELVTTAKHFLQRDVYVWKCANGHLTEVPAERMFDQ